MKLIKIKVAGFKSFVDPTTILLPSDMIAIVGPNGCGKSNIIDAVTWVMGESSAKYLRGESLTDVIFNGSSARKPIGQASVELIFDNSDASIGGEFAKFTEVSIKRIINRDSESTYYLNNSRCRKRDIADILLGTGLGPRSYSIIGQNMVSRIIEAKPDELRAYLEEAAGISKYKERRHETELRIGHTKENLARVNDVKGELETQLNHLQHQANVAEKFKTLKEQERLIRAELLATEWREIDAKLVNFSLKIQHDETALEAKQSALVATDNELNQLRSEKRMAQDAFQDIQRRYYAVGNEITRIEQDVLHHEERKKQWEQDIHQTDDDWRTVKKQILESEETLIKLDDSIQSLTPTFEKQKYFVSQLETEFSDTEELMHDWQVKWDEFSVKSSKTTQTMQVENARIQQLEQRLQSVKTRHDNLKQDENRFAFDTYEKEIETLEKLKSELSDIAQQHEETLEEAQTTLTTIRSQKQQTETELNTFRSALQRLQGQLASFEALQETALGQQDTTTNSWLQKHDLTRKPRLAQSIEVEKEWELALEKVLGLHLQAICLDNIQDVMPHLSDFQSGKLALFTHSAHLAQTSSGDKKRLLDKIKTSLPLDGILSGIYLADSLSEAERILPALAIHESVITKDGIWLGHGWVKVLRDIDPTAGILEREKKMKELGKDIDESQARITKLTSMLDEYQSSILTLEDEREQVRKLLQRKQAELSEANALCQARKQQLDHLQTEYQRYSKELSECANQMQLLEAELETATDSCDSAKLSLDQQSDERDAILSERDKARKHYQVIREQYDDEKDQLHELQIQLQTAKSRHESLTETTIRLQQQLSTLHERKTNLQNELSTLPEMDSLQTTLSRALDQHVNVESELNTARSATDTLEQEMQFLDEKRHTLEKEINQIRGALETLRIDSQGFRVKTDTILEQLQETNSTLEDILPTLSTDATTDAWRTKLEQLQNRINRLGPINLMAIDEYNTCLERKTYIDQQLNDLQAGLQTLEEAIAKIDRETKARFKETFDKVNERFQELFPTIFGGGKAYLELTDDNLLEAGVTLMACPPGKRNSSIYLLSGGEKSLTAIALIFSIFHLNPAPFCLLDEVDAALDDANVVRFTRLVKAMTGKTQFIFISHNKITIEMGEHLIGVTMNEPGVSRLVSVDIQKAISMAGT